jgi:SAM-dependent methyltransferase
LREDPSLFGKEYYDTNYRDYVRQNPDYKLAFYRQLVLDHTHDIAEPRILDMGCAFGRFLADMDPRWRRAGIDISEYAVREAARSIHSVCFAAASCTAIPFRGPFHAIVAFDVIEHVPDLASVAAFVNSELDKNGVFVFVVPVYDGPLGGIVRMLDKDPTHVHKNPREFWLTWARQSFEIVSWTGIFRYLLPVGPYINWPNRRLRHIAPAIAVTVRRSSASRSVRRAAG